MSEAIDNNSQPDVTKFPLTDEELAELVFLIMRDPVAMQPVSESVVFCDEKSSTITG